MPDGHHPGLACILTAVKSTVIVTTDRRSDPLNIISKIKLHKDGRQPDQTPSPRGGGHEQPPSTKWQLARYQEKLDTWNL
jgi:hypothetical protein